MSGAFDGEDFITFDAPDSNNAVASSSRIAIGRGAGGQTEAKGAARNRVAGLMADAGNAAPSRNAGDRNDKGKAPMRGSSDKNAGNGQSKKGGTSNAANRASAGTKRKHNEISTKEPHLTKKERKDLYSASTPWSVDVDWDRCRNGAEMLHREVMAFDNWLTPTKAELECRDMVIALIRKAIQSKWPDADVRPFGSHNTRLYLPEGDIDLVVLSHSMNTISRETVLRNMAFILRTNNLARGNVQVIARAKVPIVKFICAYGEYKVDISVNQSNGLTAADFVSKHLTKQPALRPLIMVVKQLLAQRNLSEVFMGGLGSYAVILTVISFLQMHPRVQRREIDPAGNLGVLLLEYFELYGKRFAYEELGVSVRGNGSYFNKAMRGWLDARNPGKLSLEDPLDTTNDVSVGSHNIYEVKLAFSGAFDLITAAIGERSAALGGPAGSRPTADEIRRKSLRKGDSRYSDEEDEWARQMIMAELDQGRAKDPLSFLGKLFGIKPSTIKHRKKIQTLWESNELQIKLDRPTARMSPQPGPSSNIGAPQQLPARASRQDSSRNALASINQAVRASIQAANTGMGMIAKGLQSVNGKRRADAVDDAQDEEALQLSNSDDDEEEESRYRSQGRPAKRTRSGRSAADPIIIPNRAAPNGTAQSGQAPETAFVIDDSGSSAGGDDFAEVDEVGDDDVPGGNDHSQDRSNGSAAPWYQLSKEVIYNNNAAVNARKRQRTDGGSEGFFRPAPANLLGANNPASPSASTSAGNQRRATRGEIDAYWTSKGNMDNALEVDDDDEDEVVFVGSGRSPSK
ncbi:hypothetical protein OC846_002055 [Tilletia horrida]|uniref:polynucleotide adenylyltransferase n=1 Tax=Tilletia horrida TaxID=155126 RepID=A0AAN6JZB6_9BASI|nr:hypothetical protein OC846_002055 [Tilletia horrida]KAK0568267.1 hypothetical protein OC861_002131 [Tilletia horrida]